MSPRLPPKFEPPRKFGCPRNTGFFFFVGANHKAKKALKGANEANKKVLKGANGNENMLEYL